MLQNKAFIHVNPVVINDKAIDVPKLMYEAIASD